MDNIQNTPPWEGPQPYTSQPYAPKPKAVIPAQKQELIFGALTALFSLLMCNCLLFAGANLGFALGAAGSLCSGLGYLRSRGHRPDRYALALWALCLVIVAAFPRSSDGGLKFWMVCILLVVPSLALCLTAGKNRCDPNGFLSLLDGPRTLFGLGFGRMGEASRGLREAFKATGSVGRKGSAVFLGLVIAIPLLAVMIPLLLSADAAFEGLLELLPDFEGRETVVTVLLGVPLALVLYARTAALHHGPAKERQAKPRKGAEPLTVNTVLIAASLVYVVYLISQLAYFVGGFSGILPEGYTMAEYARRGFFEMAWLCAINLAVISLSVGLVAAKEKAPRSTRLICLFLGLVTLFLVIAASAKMFLYIGSYGLTRLRVLTEVFMLWLALTTVFVCIWLFRSKLPYMKLVMLTGLVFCAGLMWADVDGRVAAYNVHAYESGKLETVDVAHLSRLSNGAVPYLYELAYDPDPEIAREAKDALFRWDTSMEDARGWNYTAQQAARTLEQFHMEVIVTELRLGTLSGSLEVWKNNYDDYGGEYAAVVTLQETPDFAGWKDVAELPETLRAVLYGSEDYDQGPYFRVEGKMVIPEIENGLYYFYDRYSGASDPTDPSKFLNHGDKNFTLAIYDQDEGKLYFMAKDV